MRYDHINAVWMMSVGYWYYLHRSNIAIFDEWIVGN